MEQPAATRLQFVAAARTDDSDIRAEVERLLRQDVDSDLVANIERAVGSALETGERSGAIDADAGGQLLGRTLSHYQVIQELSRGGMGIVYKALDLKLNREVALKVLPPQLVSDANRKHRFVREAQSAAALKHPNIAVVYQIDEVEGETFIAMELIEGQMLSDLLKRGPLTHDRSRKLALDVARGLAHAHAKGIIHRDVKPANIMVTEDGEGKIIDFGLAKLRFDVEPARQQRLPEQASETRSVDTLPGTLMGTVGYMSPEQVRASDVDARSDIFSLGAVVYEMLSARMAFGRDTNAETLSAILSERVPEVAGARELMRIVHRCLEKAPADRFQSATDVVAELERVSASRAPSEKSVAILPFTNMSPDPENEYFSDGMSEEIINALHRVRGLRVASRTSSFSFKGRLVDIAEVGVKLNVDSVLEGSVRKAGSKLRITAQLIDVPGGGHLWSESYDREWGDIFAIQGEIANAIVDGLKVTLADKPGDRLIKPTTENLDAYQLYLQGRFYWNRRELRQAIERLEQAIAIDPDYALAHAGLAATYATLGFGYGGHPGEVMGKARRAAEHSFRLDPNLAETHYALAYVSFVYNRDWAAAAGEFEKAIALDPTYAPAHYMYGFYLWLAHGRLDEAMAVTKHAVDLDPLDSHAVGMHGLVLWAGGRAHDAIPMLERAVERDPTYFFLYRCLGLVYQAHSRYSEALASLEQAANLSKRDFVVLMDLARAYAASNDPESAEEILDELIACSEHEYVSALCLAVIQSALGRKEDALDLLERSYQEQEPMLVVVKWWPMYFESLHGEARYESLLGRVGW